MIALLDRRFEARNVLELKRRNDVDGYAMLPHTSAKLQQRLGPRPLWLRCRRKKVSPRAAD